MFIQQTESSYMQVMIYKNVFKAKKPIIKLCKDMGVENWKT